MVLTVSGFAAQEQTLHRSRVSRFSLQTPRSLWTADSALQVVPGHREKWCCMALCGCLVVKAGL